MSPSCIAQIIFLVILFYFGKMLRSYLFFLATKIPILSLLDQIIILIQTNIVIFHPSLSCLQLLFCSLYTFSLSVHASWVKRIVCLIFFEFYLLFYWFLAWFQFKGLFLGSDILVFEIIEVMQRSSGWSR